MSQDMQAIETLRRELASKISRVPASFGSWDVMAVREFKALVLAGKKLAAKSRPSANELNALISRLQALGC